MALKISIVTPSYNQGQFLEETITSVLGQQYPNLEYMVIDGGSTDNSVEVIRKYEKYLHYWVSEKDSGQANAINKGLSRCTGEVFNWLNSDDYLSDGALAKIAGAFSNPQTNLVAGKVRNFSTEKSEIVANQHLTSENLLRWAPGTQFVQPGVWMRRKHVVDCGGIDEQFHYAFDWDLLIRYLYNFSNIRYLDEVLVNFRMHINSKTESYLPRFSQEEQTIIRLLFNNGCYAELHPVCEWKMKRTDWTDLLNSAIRDTGRSKLLRIKRIAVNLHRQPADLQTWRMTVGALRKIFFSVSI